MAGYWPSSVFACLFSRSINTQEKDKGYIHIYIMIFDLAGPGEEIPSGQDSSILSARVANHITGFGSSCPLTELAI